MRGCVVSLGLVAPFWIGAYVLVGWQAVALLATAGVAVELVLFRDDWLPLLGRFRRRIAGR